MLKNILINKKPKTLCIITIYLHLDVFIFFYYYYYCEHSSTETIGMTQKWVKSDKSAMP